MANRYELLKHDRSRLSGLGPHVVVALAKVAELEVVLVVHKDGGGAKVAVHETLGMQVPERNGGLMNPLPDALLGQLLALVDRRPGRRAVERFRLDEQSRATVASLLVVKR